MSLNLKRQIALKKENANINENYYLMYSFFGKLIKKGKKDKSRIIFKNLLILLKKEFPNEHPMDVLLKFFSKTKPSVGLRLKKVAGINYNLPYPINKEKSSKIAIGWFFNLLKSRNEKALVDKIFREINEGLKGKGLIKQKKESFEKIALDNRFYIFFLKR